MRIKLVSTNLGSQSLKRLAQELTVATGKKVWRGKSPRANRLNLTYGGCCDKITQYKWYEANGIQSVPYTTNAQVAKVWAKEGNTVFARLLTRASEGKGIVVIESEQNMVSAPVYTKYVPKKREFRVHVFKDRVVHVLEKKKRTGSEVSSTKVRNLANGWVFCSEIEQVPEGLKELALLARKVTSSDFVGVDIGYNEKKNLLFVIECNSAPGIEGSNVQRYVEKIKQYAHV
jgi:glutathione synthase/RimK-type ligase-like ATP-grasp enzyme